MDLIYFWLGAFVVLSILFFVMMLSYKSKYEYAMSQQATISASFPEVVNPYCSNEQSHMTLFYYQLRNSREVVEATEVMPAYAFGVGESRDQYLERLKKWGTERYMLLLDKDLQDCNISVNTYRKMINLKPWVGGDTTTVPKPRIEGHCDLQRAHAPHYFTTTDRFIVETQHCNGNGTC